MKELSRLFTIVLFITFSFSAVSCAKDNYTHNYKQKRQGASTSTLAIETKNKPVRKNFVIPDKKKKILGQKKPKVY